MHQQFEQSCLQDDGKRILAELASARGLRGQDLATVCEIIQTSERRALRAVAVWVSLLVAMLSLIYAAKWIAGWDNKDANALLLMLTFAPLVVIFSRANMVRVAIERRLRCRSCHKAINGFEVMKVRDTHQCPHCSAPNPFSGHAGNA